MTAPDRSSNSSGPSSPLPATRPATGAQKAVKVAMFGDVTIENGVIQLMDGGIHGVQGHTLVIWPNGSVRWERRIDSFMPRGQAGSGQLELTPEEVARLHSWSDALWDLAPKGTAAFDNQTRPEVPRWVWAIVMRRGDEVRVLTGGGIARLSNAPEPAKSALAWLGQRVDDA